MFVQKYLDWKQFTKRSYLRREVYLGVLIPLLYRFNWKSMATFTLNSERNTQSLASDILNNLSPPCHMNGSAVLIALVGSKHHVSVSALAAFKE